MTLAQPYGDCSLVCSLKACTGTCLVSGPVLGTGDTGMS